MLLSFTSFAYIYVPTTESYTVLLVHQIVCVTYPSSTYTWVSAVNIGYIYFYYIVFPVLYCLNPKQCQKHLHRYHTFSNTTGKHCIFAINQHKVSGILLMILLTLFSLSGILPLVPLAFEFYVFCIYIFVPTNESYTVMLVPHIVCVTSLS